MSRQAFCTRWSTRPIAGLGAGARNHGQASLSRRSRWRSSPELRRSFDRGSGHHGALPGKLSVFCCAYGCALANDRAKCVSPAVVRRTARYARQNQHLRVTSRRCLPRKRTTRRSPRAMQQNSDRYRKRLPPAKRSHVPRHRRRLHDRQGCARATRNGKPVPPDSTVRTAATPCRIIRAYLAGPLSRLPGYPVSRQPPSPATAKS